MLRKVNPDIISNNETWLKCKKQVTILKKDVHLVMVQ